MGERNLVAVTGEWHCAKCEGAADVPEHHRFCPKRDQRLKVDRVVVVAWPPFGRRRARRHGRPGPSSN